MSEHGLQISQNIDASIEDVWQVLTRLEGAADILQGVTSIEMLTEGPYAVGTRWRETRVMMGRSETQEMYVTEVQAPRRTVVQADNPGVTYRTVFELSEQTSDGQPQTLLTMHFSAEAENPHLFHRIMWRLFGRMGLTMAGKAMAQDLRDIANAAQGS